MISSRPQRGRMLVAMRHKEKQSSSVRSRMLDGNRKSRIGKSETVKKWDSEVVKESYNLSQK